MFRRSRKPSDFRAEIETERLREQGLREEDARAAAGGLSTNVTQGAERFYESGRWHFWARLRQDLRLALCMLPSPADLLLI